MARLKCNYLRGELHYGTGCITFQRLVRVNSGKMQGQFINQSRPSWWHPVIPAMFRKVISDLLYALIFSHERTLPFKALTEAISFLVFL